MRIKQLGEVIWKFYYDGRAKATAQTLSKADILQMSVLSYGELVRQKFYESKARDEYNQPDYSFLSPILTVQRFPLDEANMVGMRRADMSKFDLVRLPKNAHITNVYPVGSDCGGQAVGEITQVSPGEENFFLSPDFTSFLFFVVKGRGLNTYHVPPCIKSIEVETTYVTDDFDVSLDIGYEIAMSVLTVGGKVNGQPIKILDNTYSPQPREIKQRLQEAENTP